jgi:hypothetical protein
MFVTHLSSGSIRTLEFITHFIEKRKNIHIIFLNKQTAYKYIVKRCSNPLQTAFQMCEGGLFDQGQTRLAYLIPRAQTNKSIYDFTAKNRKGTINSTPMPVISALEYPFTMYFVFKLTFYRRVIYLNIYYLKI